MTTKKGIYVIMAITLISVALIVYANIATNPGGVTKYDCNIDVKNISNKDAYDLAVVFEGECFFAATYDGDDDGAHFENHDVAYDSTNNRTTLHWDIFRDGNDNKLTKDEIVHVGWKFIGAKTDIVDAYWTDINGARILIDPKENIIVHIKTNWRRTTAGGLELNWANNYDRSTSAYVGELHAVVMPSEVPLGDLNTANTLLNSSMTPVPGGELINIPHGTEAFLQFPTPVQIGDVVVLRYSVGGPEASADVLSYFQFVVQ